MFHSFHSNYWPWSLDYFHHISFCSISDLIYPDTHMRLLSAAWCELETPGVLRRQPFSRNGSFYKGGVDWIGPTCTVPECPSGELGIIQGSCGMNGRVGIHFLPDQFDVTTVDTIISKVYPHCYSGCIIDHYSTANMISISLDYHAAKIIQRSDRSSLSNPVSKLLEHKSFCWCTFIQTVNHL
jgi:hypothetical protein